MRHTQRGKSNFFSLTVLAALAIFSYGGYLFGPIQWHYLLVKKCTKDALLEYKVSGALSSAKTQLKSSFFREGVPEYINPKRDCKFHESRRSLRVICQWSKTVLIPGIEKSVTREYYISASIDEAGVVEQF